MKQPPIKIPEEKPCAVAHCWHAAWNGVKTCCWCGATVRAHGPHLEKIREPRLEVTWKE